MAPRVRMANTVSQAASPHSPNTVTSPGGQNSPVNASASGTAEAYMKGWRRPSLDCQLSDSEPANGSVTASNSRAMKSARPASVPGNSSTWL